MERVVLHFHFNMQISAYCKELCPCQTGGKPRRMIDLQRTRARVRKTHRGVHALGYVLIETRPFPKVWKAMYTESRDIFHRFTMEPFQACVPGENITRTVGSK